MLDVHISRFNGMSIRFVINNSFHNITLSALNITLGIHSLQSHWRYIHHCGHQKTQFHKSWCPTLSWNWLAPSQCHPDLACDGLPSQSGSNPQRVPSHGLQHIGHMCQHHAPLLYHQCLASCRRRLHHLHSSHKLE
jgi:hypothetical protein